ncbi:MAG: hypothetical protein QM533_13495 [Cytophagales bacterium]|nr:hypothetical protein [Cytophagales bacterium]
MALKDSKHAPEIDLFRLELVNIIDNRHAPTPSCSLQIELIGKPAKPNLVGSTSAALVAQDTPFG